jgi:hypothetical protein
MGRFPCTGRWRLPLFAALLAACLWSDLRTAAAGTAAVPVAVSALQSFKGSIAYAAHDTADPGRTIAGDLSVGRGRFTLDERSDAAILHISDTQSWLQQDGRKLYFEDPLAADELANPWAVMLGASVTLPISADPSGHSWRLGGHMRVYPDGSQGGLAGLVDIAPGADVSFSFDGWQDVQGMWMPSNVVRFRNGVVEKSFVIDSYRVAFAPGERAAPAGEAQVTVPVSAPERTPDTTSASGARGLRFFLVLFAWLALGLAVAAWMRRDAIAGAVGRRLASDPRAWRDEGTSVFVSPEGFLSFGGRRYRVGAAFFNRRVNVQSSPFFIRVSAPGTGMPLVLARKFPLHDLAASSRKAAGFTLVEALVATALFACVIVAAVFPTLVVLAHADRVAALHETAIEVANNALVDEETALAYGASTVATGSATSRVDGLDLTITVTPTSIAGMQLVTAAVDDPSGAPLARIATMVGPPVPPPDDTPSPPSTR